MLLISKLIAPITRSAGTKICLVNRYGLFKQSVSVSSNALLQYLIRNRFYSSRANQTYFLQDIRFKNLLKRLEEEYHQLVELRTGAGLKNPDQKRLVALTPSINLIHQLNSTEKYMEETRSLYQTGNDESMNDLILEELDELDRTKRELLSQLIDSIVPEEIDDVHNILLEVQAGAGGLEAGIFAYELYRMYENLCQRQGWTITPTDLYSPEESFGKKCIHKITAEICGQHVYKYLKFESGVHRVQRVPVTESGGRMHTSTAVVILLPKPTEIQVNISPKDVKIDAYRSSGGGGQHANKTESAIRMTHIPTGTVVECEQKRSQLENRKLAMILLKSRLFETQLTSQQEKTRNLRKLQIGGANRNEKIRTYNFQQNKVVDHRIKLTSNDLQSFMMGEDVLLEFLKELHVYERHERLDNLMKSV